MSLDRLCAPSGRVSQMVSGVANVEGDERGRSAHRAAGDAAEGADQGDENGDARDEGELADDHDRDRPGGDGHRERDVPGCPGGA
ncbi:hypothetical protein RB200_22600 [Streptomyces sp. PmtG]